jgi:hypothetical protein
MRVTTEKVRVSWVTIDPWKLFYHAKAEIIMHNNAYWPGHLATGSAVCCCCRMDKPVLFVVCCQHSELN